MDLTLVGDPLVVRHFRQILLWPLQLMPTQAEGAVERHWEILDRAGPESPWREVADEFTGDPAQFQERHYGEFVTFLPHVQRFLYGEGKGSGAHGGSCDSPIRVYRRADVASVRLTHREGELPTTLKVSHVDLYFFFDIDIAVLVVEVQGEELPLARVHDTLYRFGRAYPRFWKRDDRASSCLERVEWLAANGDVLAVSDYEKRRKYLDFVCRYRAPCIASHWEFLLEPLALHHSDRSGSVRYRLIEHHRMPLMAYLALDDPRQLARSDFVRLGLVLGADDGNGVPYSEWHLADFERRHCDDRFWSETPPGPSTRYLVSGQALVVVGCAGQPFFVDPDVGVLGQFRHQHFLIYLVAHFHRATLLMLSDRLVHALNALDIRDPASIKRFKRVIRGLFEVFLRFTHRYWFHDIADQPQAKSLFRGTAQHLETDRLYREIEDAIEKMSTYLDSDSLRRQASTVVRLTVVTTVGLIATVTTGFLGMNLLALADAPLATRSLYFVLTAVPTTVLTLFAVARSKRLSDFLEALSDERLTACAKMQALTGVFGRRRPGAD